MLCDGFKSKFETTFTKTANSQDTGSFVKGNETTFCASKRNFGTARILSHLK